MPWDDEVWSCGCTGEEVTERGHADCEVADLLADWTAQVRYLSARLEEIGDAVGMPAPQSRPPSRSPVEIVRAVRAATISKLRAEIERVRSLHRPVEGIYEEPVVCEECRTRYPCATIRPTAADDDDPITWCDCRPGETCQPGPCRRREGLGQPSEAQRVADLVAPGDGATDCY